MQGQHTIKLSDGKEIPIRFCTWTFTRFAEKAGGLSYSGLITMLNNGEITGKQVMLLLLCAAEYYYVRENKQFHFSELDAADWIDDLGGLYSPKVAEMIGASTKALVQVQEPTGEPVQAEEGEKNAVAST